MHNQSNYSQSATLHYENYSQKYLSLFAVICFNWLLSRFNTFDFNEYYVFGIYIYFFFIRAFLQKTSKSNISYFPHLMFIAFAYFYINERTFSQPNHQFLMMMIFLFFSITEFIKPNKALFYKGMRGLYLIVMVFATFHKFFTDFFITGDLFLAWFSRGMMFFKIDLFGDQVMEYFPKFYSSIEKNSTEWTNFLTVQLPNIKIHLPNHEIFSKIFLVMAWAVSIFELILTLLPLSKKTHKVFHYLFIPFVIFTAIFTMELLFMSLLLLFALFLYDDIPKKIHNLYYYSAAALSLIYPWSKLVNNITGPYTLMLFIALPLFLLTLNQDLITKKLASK